MQERGGSYHPRFCAICPRSVHDVNERVFVAHHPGARRNPFCALVTLPAGIPESAQLRGRWRVETLMFTSLRAIALLALSTALLPAQQPVRDSSRAQPLPKVVTTASRYSASRDSLPRRVEVITRAVIDATPALDMLDLLKKRAMLDVVQYPGLLGGVAIRGFRPQVGSLQQRVLILLDGRPSGITNVSLLDVQDVERVEVLKGPASALYGSTAMGGVINVVTRHRTGPVAGIASASAGSFGSTDVKAQLGGTIAGGVDADVSLRRFDQRNDFQIGSGSVLRGIFGSDSALKIYPNGTTPNRYVTDTLGGGVTRTFTTMRTNSGTLRVGGSVVSGVRLDVRGDLFDANGVPTPGDIFSINTPFPGNGRKNTRRVGTSAEVSGARGAHRLLVRAFRTNETSDFFDRPDSARFVSFASGARTVGLQLQDVLQLRQQQIAFGLDATQQRATSRYYINANTEAGTFSPNSEVRSLAAFAETRVTALDGRLIATVGGRADRVTLSLLSTPLRSDVEPGDDTFAVFNPSAGLLFNIGGGVRAHGTVGRAFLAPDAFGRAGLTQQVTAGVATIAFGNPNLRAEQSSSADIGIGVTKARGAFDLDVTYFATQVDNRISRARAAFAVGQRPTLVNGARVARVETSVNAGTADIRGLEGSVRYDIGAAAGRVWSLNLFANMTRMFTATESTPTVTVDAAQFNGVTNFSPASIVSGVRITGPTRSDRIKNVAAATWNVGLEYDDHSRWRAGLLGRYVGTRLDEDFSDFSDISDIEYPPFAVADLTVGARITRRVRADLQLSNVTNENYYEKRGYNLAGRAFSVRVTTSF
jgi:vitamin B12 transporter